MDNELPSFKKPPLVETALSVQFKQLEGFGNAHLGFFWNQYLRTQYPKVMDAEPIAPQIELFGADVIKKARLPSFRIVTGQGAARLQMLASDEQAMIQIQNGRLVHNWRRLTDGTYPRWHGVLPAFQAAWSMLQTYLKENALGPVEMSQWEIIYVNHLYKGREWLDETGIHRVLPGLIGTVGETSIATPESLGCHWQFLLPEDTGRLRIDLSHGYTGIEPEGQEVLVLQLTVRGNIVSDTELSQALTKGREAIVRIFTEITGPDAHSIWEREQ